MDPRIEQALHLFDAYNKQDPQLFFWQGAHYPQEYFLAQKLYEWVLKLNPDAGDALILASRSQHIGRWEIPRDSFPLDKSGYLLWRKTLASHHATKAGDILRHLSFSDDLVERVQEIILKKKIKVNPEVQTMENALCLVFLEYQYEAFFPKHRDKIVQILRKSLLKMDGEGHRFALTLSFSEEGFSYIQDALSLLGEKAG
jgi:hypothetical protein